MEGGGDSPTSPSNSRAVTLGVSAGRYTGSGVDVDVAGPLTGVGGAVLVESIAGVFLLARTAAGTYSAIDAVCSHQSCTVTSADDAAYVCPCHGSRYDRNGRVLNGPATAALRQFPTTVASAVVTIVL